MTIQQDLRLTPADGGAAVFEFKRFLKTLGWTVPRSSDGLTYNATGDQITSNASGANGIKNARSWFVLRQPAIASGSYATPTTPSGAVREWLFQRDTANGNTAWRALYSRNVPFGDGSFVAIAGNVLVDGTDRFTINDGTHGVKTFEFDSNSSVTGGNVAVPFTSADTAATVAASMTTAINGAGLNVVARISTSGLSTVVSLGRTPSNGALVLTESVANAGFSFSVPTSTVTPAASGSGIVIGGGTDASPTMAPLFPPDGTYRWNINADDAAPFGFCGFGWTNGGGGDGPALLFDPMIDGTFIPFSASGDSDPYVCFAGFQTLSGVGTSWAPCNGQLGTIGCTNAFVSGLGGPVCNPHPGGIDNSFAAVGLCVPSTSAVNPLAADGSLAASQNSGQNPFNGKDILIDVPWIRSTTLGTPSGLKGFSYYVKVNMSTQRTRGLLFTFVTPRDYVAVGGVGLLWDGGAALV